MTYRETGKKALATVLKQEQNIRIIENNIFILASREEKEVEKQYLQHVYQTVGDILTGKNIKDLLPEIKKGKMGWKHNSFQEWQNRLEEQDNFIENPFQVEEGALQCNKCKSKRVYYYQRQCRGSDEPMTTFATCVMCNAKWKYDG